MTPKLPVITSRDVIKVAVKIGFVLDRQSGSHAVFLNRQKNLRIVIPIHKGKDIKKKTLKAIIDDLGITVEEFVNFL
jgi:predicted RNA binding protein YcfA (HicA-like mRNA interferase family)